MVTERVFSVGCQKATENCSVHLLPLLFHVPECPDPEEPQSIWKETWPPLTAHLPHHHAGTDHHHTATLILMLTNGEQGRNSGCHEQECLKETPGSAEGMLLGLFQFLLYAAFFTLEKE